MDTVTYALLNSKIKDGGVEVFSAPPIKCTAEGTNISIKDSSEAPLSGMRVYGKTTQETTTGAQLLPPTTKTVTVHDVTLNIDKHEWHLTGTATGDGGRNELCREVTLPAGTYSIKSYPYRSLYVIDPAESYSIISNRMNFSLSEEKTVLIGLNVNAGVTYNETFRVMLNAGATALPYEPYTGGIPSPSPEYPQPLESVGDKGNIEVSIQGENPDDTSQILTLSTPNGFPGIPVSSGGNYTDENGQQWVCDEIDLVRGKYVRRVAKEVIPTGITFTISESEKRFVSNSFLKNKYKTGSFSAISNFAKWNAWGIPIEGGYTFSIASKMIYFSPSTIMTEAEVVQLFNQMVTSDNPPIIIGQLSEPIETDLTDEEIAAYTALHTNRPITNIINDEGAHMEAEYTADTKSYIDNKFAEIQNAILSMGGNV